MSIRFPDLQVLLPRTMEADRIAGVTLHGQRNEQEVLAEQRLARMAEEQRKVARTAEHPLTVQPDREREERPRRRPDAQKARGASGDKDGAKKGAAPGPLGGRLDIRA